MKNYLKTLIEEKGKTVDSCIPLDGHFGLTYQILIDFIDQLPSEHSKIKEQLVLIDFQNGDVFDYLIFLAKEMVKYLGLEVYSS